jgi:hypothetical protein
MVDNLKIARAFLVYLKQIRKDKHFLKKLRRESIRKCISEEKLWKNN